MNELRSPPQSSPTFFDHKATSFVEIRQLPSFTSSCHTLCLCVMLCIEGLSVSPLWGWFMASISMFTRCHCPVKKAHSFSLLLSKNECCNAALRYRQTRHRVTLSSRWDSWMTLRMLSHCYNWWAWVQTRKTHPVSSLLNHLLRGTRRSDAMNIWITDSYIQPDKGIAKAKSTEIHIRASYEAFWHVSKCVSEVAAHRPHSHKRTYTAESGAACGPSREQCTAHGCQDTVGLVISSVRLSRRCWERERQRKSIQLAHTLGEVLTTLSWASTIERAFKITHDKHKDAAHRTFKPGNLENFGLVTPLASYPRHFFLFL